MGDYRGWLDAFDDHLDAIARWRHFAIRIDAINDVLTPNELALLIEAIVEVDAGVGLAPKLAKSKPETIKNVEIS